MKKRTIYLDTNILSELHEPDMPESIAFALARLVGIEGINFVTSIKTKAEILRTPDKIKNAKLQIFYSFINKTPIRRIYISHGGGIGAGAIGEHAIGRGGWEEPDPFYIQLKTIFDEDDAHHIFQAVVGNCDYFMTLDNKTILKRVARRSNEVKKLCGAMKFVSPEDAIRLIEIEISQE